MTTRRIFTFSGFSLVELTCALVVVSLILLGIQSVTVLAAKSGVDDRNVSRMQFDVSRGLEAFRRDLAFATSIISRSNRAIEFTVPDRTGDGSEETIRYSWTGLKGSPLLRSVNGGMDAEVVSGVGTFVLTYDLETSTSESSVESAETLLQSYDTILTLSDSRVQEKNWLGQYFVPSLPNNATSWRVTRVRFKAKSYGSTTGETRVQLRRASAGLPTTVLDEVLLQESTLGSSYAWQEISFSSEGNLSPSEGLCLVFQWQNDADACAIQIQGISALGATSNLITTSDAGASWSAAALQDMIFYVYGTYSTPGASTTTKTLKRVNCTLSLRANADAAASTSVVLLNPQGVAP